MAKAARSRSRAWENRATMTMAAVTPMTVAIRRKQAFSRARPRVGSARIATVTAAVDGTSSSSQKLAAKARTTASQMRIPNAQAPTETPAGRNGRSIVVVVMLETVSDECLLGSFTQSRKPARWAGESALTSHPAGSQGLAVLPALDDAAKVRDRSLGRVF